MGLILCGFPTEKVTIIKQNGIEIKNIEALVSGNMITIDDLKADIEDNDIIERNLPNNRKEQYLVIDNGFYKKSMGFPAHYQCKVKKATHASNSNQSSTVNNYNMNGIGKVNINSTDNSINITLTEKDLSLFKELESLADTLEDFESIKATIEEMKESVGKKSFLEKYNNFIQSAANHMVIFAPYIPMLTEYII